MSLVLGWWISRATALRLLEGMLPYLHVLWNYKTNYTRRATPRLASLGLRHPFVTVAGFITLALMASSTPTPLYSIYAAQWHFSPLAVTEVYAVYAICVLLALLLTGGLSDLIGRRPVIVSALLGLIGAESIFMVAGGLDWLYVARSIQGLATGLLLGATGAALSTCIHGTTVRRRDSSTASRARPGSALARSSPGCSCSTRATPRSRRSS